MIEDSTLYQNWLQKSTIHAEMWDFYDEGKMDFKINKENMDKFCNFTADQRPENAKHDNQTW